MTSQLKSVESRHFLGSNNMASDTVPYFGISVYLGVAEETSATIPGGAMVTVWAR